MDQLRRAAPQVPLQPPGTALRRAVAIWLAAAPLALVHGAARLELLPVSPGLAVWLELGYGHWVLAGVLIGLLGLGAVALGAGARLGTGALSPAATLAFRLGAGLYVSTALLLVAALAGALPVGVGLWVAVAGGAVVLSLRSGEAPGPRRAARAARPARRWLLVAAVALVALPYWLQTLLPNSDFDSAAFHLPMAGRLLDRGLLATDPLDAATCYPAALHLVYALLVALGAEVAIAPFNLVLSGACVLAVFALAEDLWGRDAARLAALVAATVNLLWELGLDARIDNALAFAVTLAVHALLRWERRPREAAMLVTAGAMLGLALGIKYTGGFLLLGMGVPAVALVVARWRRPGLRCRTAFALALVLVALPHGAWYARNALQWGDPLYPRLGGTVYVSEAGETRSLGPDLAALEQRMPPPADYVPTPEVIGDAHLPSLWRWWQLLDWRAPLARKPLHWVGPFPILVLLLPLVVRRRSSVLIVFVAGVFYALVAESAYLVRYLLPVLPLMSAGAGAVLARPRSRAWRIPVVAVLSAFVLANAGLEGLKLLDREPCAYLSGAEDPLEWLEGVGYNGDRGVVRVLRGINAAVATGRIGAGETIYMVGEGRGHRLVPRWIPDTSATAQRWASELVRADGSLERVRDAFARRGIHWILFNPERYTLTRRELPSRRVYEEQRFALYQLSRFLERYARLAGAFPPSKAKLFRLGGDGVGPPAVEGRHAPPAVP